jgi:hypothetical protein
MALKKPKPSQKVRKIRCTVEFPFAGVDPIEEYYDLPSHWDSMTEAEQDKELVDYAMEELSNSGVGCGASVVEVED